MVRNAQNKITAQFECEWIELPDNKLGVATFELAPYHYFGNQFDIQSIENAPITDDASPRRSIAAATVSRRLFRLMFRYQAGSEAIGDEPPDWALVVGSAVDAATGEAVDPHSV